MTIDSFLSRFGSTREPSIEYPILPATFSIADAGPFPLKQHIKPDGHPLGGELLLSFEHLIVEPVTFIAVQPDSHHRQLNVTLGPVSLSGRYQLFYNECAQVTLDTGGLMGALPAESEDTGQMTEARYWQLVQLEQERAELNQTANGRLLVEEYNQHNDAYHQVFTENEQLRKYWHQDDASDEMGEHTCAALKSGAVINPPEATFGSNSVSYNSNAFSQQLNLFFACLADYPEAATAALSFNETVTGETGNSQTTTVALNRSQIFDSVNASSPIKWKAGPSARVRALQDALINIIVKKTASAVDIDICHQQGFVMDPETRQRLQTIYWASLRKHDPKQRVDIISEGFNIDLASSEFTYALTEQPGGALTVKLLATTLNISQIPLPSGVAAEVNTRFIRGLLVDRIASQLTRCLRELARQEG